MFACLTDNIQHIFFLVSELSIDKKNIYTRQVACVSYLINPSCIARQWGLQLILAITCEKHKYPDVIKKQKTQTTNVMFIYIILNVTKSITITTENKGLNVDDLFYH
jgi:hypothetical protein